MEFFLKRFTNKFTTKNIQNFRKCSHFTPERLLSDESRENCLKCWTKNLQPIRTTSALNKKSKQTGDDKSVISSKNSDISAAVLVPMCVDKDDEVSLLYTKRSSKLSRHVRQISFPGGLRDSTDVSYEDCALRETEEEIGLNKSRVEIWGAGSMVIVPQRPPITPVIGVIRNFSIDELKLNTDEVEEAFTVPIKKLCSKDVMSYTQFKTGYSTPVFILETKRIWGITAYITRMFLQCLLPKDVYKHDIEFLRPYKVDKK